MMSAVQSENTACQQDSAIAVRFPELSQAPKNNAANGPPFEHASPEYHAGYDAGFAAASSQGEASEQALAKKLGAATTAIDQQYRQECAALLVQLLTSIAPSLITQSIQAQVKTLLDEHIANAAPGLAIHLHPDLCTDDFTIATLTDEQAAGISLRPDETLDRGTLKVKWDGGGQLFDPQSLTSALIEELENIANS